MAQLEQRLRESDLQVHGALLGRGASYGDMCVLRLQVGQKKRERSYKQLGMFISWPSSKTIDTFVITWVTGASKRERVPEGAVC